MFSENTLSAEALQLLCEQIQILSLQVGKFIASERKKVLASDIISKGTSDFVSYVDKIAEKKFVEGLKIILPQAGFIAEEDSSLPKGDKYNWVIDPLDGTTNYLHGVPCFATSIALIENNIPVLGVIHEINQDECFYAWKEGGAWLNGERIQIGNKSELKDSLIATGFPYQPQAWHDQYIALFSDVHKSCIGMRRAGSAATDIAYVACGRYDGYYEYGIHAWDVAAGAVLIQEAGGIVTDFLGGGDYIFGRKFVCGNNKVHAELLVKIKNHFQ